MSWQTREKVLAGLLTLFALALAALIAWILIDTQRFRPCQTHAAKEDVKNFPNASYEEGWLQAARYLRNSIDFDTDPCNDFYQFACGTWVKLNPLPEIKDRQDAFSLAREKVKTNTKQVLDSLSNASNTNHSSQAVNILKWTFDACQNVTRVEMLRSEPLRAILDAESGWPALTGEPVKQTVDPMYLIGRLTRYYNVHTLLAPSVYADQKNTTHYVLFLDQAVLAFGPKSEDYYLRSESRYVHVREAYHTLMLRVATFIRKDTNKPEQLDADNSSFKDILNFEIEIAKINTPADQRRNESAMYNKWTVGALKKETPGLQWDEYFRGLGIDDRMVGRDDQATLIVVEPNYLRNLSTLLRKTDKRTLFNYLIWRLILDRIVWLDDRFVQAIYAFLHDLKGSSAPIRWDTCMGYVIGEPDDGREFLGYAAGRLFVNSHFSPEAKSKTQEMVQNIIVSFEHLLDKLTWMDNTTKVFAKKKAQGLKTYNSVGYPDFIKNDTALDEYYKGLSDGEPPKIGAFQKTDSFFEMNTKILFWMVGRQFKKLGKPFDRRTFGGSPAIVNAWYSSIKNSIVFPAGILQPPFFHAQFPMAINYGAIGSVIGHEITHGFDDQGAQSDQDGNLNDWWTKESENQFRQRQKCISEQYSKFCYPKLGSCVKGQNTLGENIADNGGLKQAYYAYQMYIQKAGAEQRLPSLERFTMEQIFFLSFASFWCGDQKEKYLQNLLATNEHSPGQYRVVGTLQNFNEFSKAFNCPDGSYMNPAKKCHVW